MRIAAVIAVLTTEVLPIHPVGFRIELFSPPPNDAKGALGGTWDKVKVVVNGMLQTAEDGRMKKGRRDLCLEFVVTFMARRNG